MLIPRQVLHGLLLKPVLSLHGYGQLLQLRIIDLTGRLCALRQMPGLGLDVLREHLTHATADGIIGLEPIAAARVHVDIHGQIGRESVALLDFLIQWVILIAGAAHADLNAMPHQLILAGQRHGQGYVLLLEPVRRRAGILAAVTYT